MVLAVPVIFIISKLFKGIFKSDKEQAGQLGAGDSAPTPAPENKTDSDPEAIKKKIMAEMGAKGGKKSKRGKSKKKEVQSDEQSA